MIERFESYQPGIPHTSTKVVPGQTKVGSYNCRPDFIRTATACHSQARTAQQNYLCHSELFYPSQARSDHQMNRPTPLSHAHNRPASALSTNMLTSTASSIDTAHKVNSSTTMTILDRIAAERHKIQEEDNKRHQQYRREATSISCKHRISGCSDDDVSPPAYGLVPTASTTEYTHTFDKSSSSNAIANAYLTNYDGAKTPPNSSKNACMRLVQISSAASQQRRNSASNANERHFLFNNTVGNDLDDRSPPSSSSTSPAMTPTKRRPHPNSLLSTTWNMASSQSIHDEMERIRLLVADMDSQPSRSQQRKPRSSSILVAPPVSPTKLASRKTR